MWAESERQDFLSSTNRAPERATESVVGINENGTYDRAIAGPCESGLPQGEQHCGERPGQDVRAGPLTEGRSAAKPESAASRSPGTAFDSGRAAQATCW